MQKEEIEIQLWEYIDGTCSDADKERITALLANDSEWKHIYEELTAFHNTVSNNIKTAEPSARFTASVMAGLETQPVKGKSYSSWVTKGIAAFFIISIGILLAYNLYTIDWHTSSAVTQQLPSRLPQVHIPEININSYGLAETMAFITVIGILVLFDQVNRQRKMLGNS